MNALSIGTNDFSISIVQPNQGGCHVQDFYPPALSLTVNYGFCKDTSVTDMYKSLVGLYRDKSKIESRHNF